MPDMLVRLAQIDEREHKQTQPARHDRLTDGGKLRRMGGVTQNGPGNARQISRLPRHEQQAANGEDRCRPKNKLEPRGRRSSHSKGDEHANADEEALIEKVIAGCRIKSHALLQCD